MNTLSAPAPAPAAPPQAAALYGDHDDINLIEYVDILIDHKWWIAGITALVAGDEEVFLLGSREIAASGDLDVYSEASPLGQAILGLKIGEKTSYEAPNGRAISVEVTGVETYSG